MCWERESESDRTRSVFLLEGSPKGKEKSWTCLIPTTLHMIFTFNIVVSRNHCYNYHSFNILKQTVIYKRTYHYNYHMMMDRDCSRIGNTWKKWLMIWNCNLEPSYASWRLNKKVSGCHYHKINIEREINWWFKEIMCPGNLWILSIVVPGMHWHFEHLNILLLF